MTRTELLLAILLTAAALGLFIGGLTLIIGGIVLASMQCALWGGIATTVCGLCMVAVFELA